MTEPPKYYDVAIVGAGLAGLSAAITLAIDGFSIAVIEKETFPFHRVCGEYLSLESADTLRRLGVPIQQLDLPVMDRLLISSPKGRCIEQRLPLGGIGISRFYLDDALAGIARERGVDVMEGKKVRQVVFDGRRFVVSHDGGSVVAAVCCGAFGKRSNLDVQWKRPFTLQRNSPLSNYIGVKYHAELDEHPRNLIALHNFSSGYCGIAPIEGNRVNICYLTTAASLRKHGNDLQAMERDLLGKNPRLAKTFASARFLFEQPITISQISFEPKEQVVDHILLMGDAAGMITPLCGNGMSMAIRGGVIAAGLVGRFLHGNIDRAFLETEYTRQWTSAFGRRLFAGRTIQRLFGAPRLTEVALAALKPFPALLRSIVRQTHG